MSAAVRIPGVEIGEELGHGAYSVVYRARQGLVDCALKLPRVRGRWTRWVYREAVALARVRHAGLPKVLEVGEADGLPYILMELASGETLADRLRRGPLTPGVVLDLGCQLADTLRVVHEVGLVHRDVKPRNIILDAGGRARLVDFGFVAPAGAGAGLEEVGTRRYSAPEQFGASDRIDGRADLFALGRVMCECLIGGAGLEAQPTMAVLELTSAGVAPSVARVVGALVAESPDDRYPDALAVLSELHRVRAGGAPRGPSAFESTRLQPPLVGRDNELERFIAAWRGVESTGGRVVFVEGIRGAGKSRFLQACTGRVRDEGRGRSLESVCREGDPPLSALRRMFESYFVSLRRLAPQERAAAMTALRAAASGPLASVATVIAPGFAEVLGAGIAAPSSVPEAFAEGAAELVLRLAPRAGPLVLCFDDVQWVDPVSRDVLAAIADRAHEAPLLLLVAARPTANSAAFADIEPTGPKRAVRISLGPLELRQTAALIASHLGVASVDPGVVRRVGALADDTPVGVLEVLGAFLDAGALRLRDNVWELHGVTADRIVLPVGALTYLGRRLTDLPRASRRVLEAAAILGTSFDERLLSRVIELEPRDVDFALADGRRSGILEAEDGGRHRFGHDSLRELLAGGLDDAQRRRWHQSAAEILTEGVPSTSEELYACAMHFAAGEVGKSPAAASRAARRAGEAALDRFDDETALRFFDMARTFADAAGQTMDAGFHRRVGEANLRIGELDESLRSFEHALDLARTAVTRAAVLGRIAWVRRARSEPDDAWAALEKAFSALGATMPVEADPPVIDVPARTARAALPADVLDVLYSLYHQHARLGLEYRKPLRTMQSAMRVLELAGLAGPSAALAQAHTTYGVVLVRTGHGADGEHHLGIAQTMALELGDPATTAYYLPRRAVALAVGGQFDAALRLFRECVEEYGPWLDLTELCDDVVNGDIIESIRGRPTEAWAWLVRATDRLRRRHRTSAVFGSHTHILYRARAALAALGRTGQEGAWLSARLDAAEGTQPERAFYPMLCWAPRARLLLESDRLGTQFEELVRTFQAEKIEPQSAPPAVFEYYVAVAQARIHQCLRSTSQERPACVAELRQAAADLRAAAKLPLIQCHSLLAEGTLAWLEGSLPKATRLLAKADALASSETCPWVSWGVARVRAHMLREKGKHDAARDQARIAEVLARAHGAEPRARWVREEFSLPAPEATGAANSTASSGGRSSRRARRQLGSLIHLMRAPYGQLKPAQQATAIVDDLVRELAADRTFLVFEPTGDPRGRMVVGRNRLGQSLPAPDGWRDALLRSVRDLGDERPTIPPGERSSPGGPPDRSRVVALPLFLNERVAGSLLVERVAPDPAFGPDDHELLLVLSHQVPIALELSRLLAERDQLHASMQQAQKMEVVGQLAGSVAHDFNNMLAVINGSFDALENNESLDGDARDDLAAIGDASRRATALTRRLLSFSRHQTLTLGPVDVNRAVTGLDQLFKRLTSSSSGVDIVTDLTRNVHFAFADEGSLDQALMNLAINARDAMPNGGALTITTRNVVLGADAVLRGAPAEGEYVAVEVADTGEGIPPETLSRIFDPFFTTKPVGKGTGLGLTTVFTFVRQCGGHIDVWSEVGRGTTFVLYFRKAEPLHLEKRTSQVVPDMAQAQTSATILVVDDDPAVGEVTSALLQQAGYRVLTASRSDDALRFARLRGTEIALVILDVHMPDMSGQELERRLADLHVPAKVLFVTGALVDDEPADGHEPLQKPFSSDALLGRVRTILHS